MWGQWEECMEVLPGSHSLPDKVGAAEYERVCRQLHDTHEELGWAWHAAELSSGAILV